MRKIFLTFAALLLVASTVFAQPQGAGQIPPQGVGQIPPQGVGQIPPQGAGQRPPQGAGQMPPQGMGMGMFGFGFGFRAPEPPSDPSYDTKEVSFTSDGKNIFGLACIPKASGRKPAIIMAHGAMGTHTGFYSQMGELAKAGYVCYAFDFSGARNGKSEGEPEAQTMATLQQNLKDALALVGGWDSVDTEKVFILGESEGGCAAALVAASVPSEVKALALVNPAFNAADVYDDIKAFEKDVLIVHGDYDKQVNIIYSEKAALLYKSCDLKVVVGGAHSMRGETKTESDGYISAFLKNQLTK